MGRKKLTVDWYGREYLSWARILEDKRPIRCIGNESGWDVHTVGMNGVTAIVAYPEIGQGAYVPWFAIYVGEDIRYRMDSFGSTVEYFPEKAES